MRNMTKEDYLNFLDISTNKELLNSLELNHVPLENTFIINGNKISAAEYTNSALNLAFKEADKLFAKISGSGN